MTVTLDAYLLTGFFIGCMYSSFKLGGIVGIQKGVKTAVEWFEENGVDIEKVVKNSNKPLL